MTLKEKLNKEENLLTLEQITELGFFPSSSIPGEYFRIVGENGVQGAKSINGKYKLYTIREDDVHSKGIGDDYETL